MRKMETMASCPLDPPYSASSLHRLAGELLSIPFLAVLHASGKAGNVYVGEQDAFTWLKLVKKPVPRRGGGYPVCPLTPVQAEATGTSSSLAHRQGDIGRSQSGTGASMPHLAGAEGREASVKLDYWIQY